LDQQQSKNLRLASGGQMIIPRHKIERLVEKTFFCSFETLKFDELSNSQFQSFVIMLLEINKGTLAFDQFCKEFILVARCVIRLQKIKSPVAKPG
jgi:hypothetical protein